MSFRRPNFSNVWSTELGRIIQRNLSGAPKFYRRAIQPVIDGFEMTVALASKVDTDAFITSVISAAGTSLSYTDFEGTVWTGFWLPESIIIRRGRKLHCVAPACEYEVSFAFRGEHA